MPENLRFCQFNQCDACPAGSLNSYVVATVNPEGILGTESVAAAIRTPQRNMNNDITERSQLTAATKGRAVLAMVLADGCTKTKPDGTSRSTA